MDGRAEVVNGLVRAAEHGNRCPHRDGRSFLDQQPANGAGHRRLHFDRRFVGLDFGEHFSLGDRLALVLQPAHQRALGHVEAELGHGDDLSHQTTSLTARMTSSTWGSAICSSSRL